MTPPSRPAAAPTRLARRARRSFAYDLDQTQRSQLIAYASFTVTVAAVRGVTRAIRSGRGPFHDLGTETLHIHHYIPGIALITAAGALGLRANTDVRVHCTLGVAYGAGCALVADELPLLLNLRDVYWTPEGAWRVQLTLAITAVLGAYFSGIPLWRAILDELKLMASPSGSVARMPSGAATARASDSALRRRRSRG